jgi:hypothetical protein
MIWNSTKHLPSRDCEGVPHGPPPTKVDEDAEYKMDTRR